MAPKHKTTDPLSARLANWLYAARPENNLFTIGACFVLLAVPLLMLGLPKGYRLPHGLGIVGTGLLTAGYTLVLAGIVMEIVVSALRRREVKRSAQPASVEKAESEMVRPTVAPIRQRDDEERFPK